MEREQHEQLQVRYEELDRDVTNLIKMERLFNDIKGKQANTLALLEEKSKLVAELRPQVSALESECKKWRKQAQELEKRLEEAQIEIMNLKSETVIMRKAETLRATLSKTKAGESRATRLS
jgi:chromosome segregation ATPase